MTRRRPPRRFWIEALLSASSGVLLVLASPRKDWIEAVFGVDPDGGSGRLEWAIAIGLAAIAVALAVAALADWRRARTAEG